MSGVRCPDCTLVFSDTRTNRHDPTCPLGRGVDQATDGDREWFAKHPRAEVYHRAITASERHDLGLVEPSHLLATHVEVTQLEPGLRSRRAYVKGVCRSCGRTSELRLVFLVDGDGDDVSPVDGLCGRCAQ